MPGPAGPRLIAVASGDRLWAVFPSERALFEGRPTEADFEALLGVPLTAPEVMDLLVGVPSPRLRAYEARWRVVLPAKVTATLPDGGRLTVNVDEVDKDTDLPDAVFAEPPHEGYRRVTAAEARGMWGAR